MLKIPKNILTLPDFSKVISDMSKEDILSLLLEHTNNFHKTIETTKRRNFLFIKFCWLYGGISFTPSLLNMIDGEILGVSKYPSSSVRHLDWSWRKRTEEKYSKLVVRSLRTGVECWVLVTVPENDGYCLLLSRLGRVRKKELSRQRKVRSTRKLVESPE